MGLFGPSVDDLARRGNIEGLIELFGPLDKRGVEARRAPVNLGRQAVPTLMSLVLHDDSAESGTLSATVAAALGVLEMIGEPTLRAATRAVETSDDPLVVANAAELMCRTALELGVTIPRDVKDKIERVIRELKRAPTRPHASVEGRLARGGWAISRRAVSRVWLRSLASLCLVQERPQLGTLKFGQDDGPS